MTPYLFDGKAFTQQREELLTKKVNDLKSSGINPKLVSIIVGNDPASLLYVNLKKKAGERVGIEVQVISLSSSIDRKTLEQEIEKLNQDDSVNGIMIQLPLPEELRSHTQVILNSIDPKKDVDGLRENSLFLHPTSKAVIEILKFALNIVRPTLKDRPLTLCIVGATGMVGKPLVRELKEKGLELWEKELNVIECNSKTQNLKPITLSSDIIISTTGISALITDDMVKEGEILIDVGSPKGDIDKNAYDKALFVSPVPGGVGPVTIGCLLENIIGKV